ncbi:MAG: rod shape-determining protein RodA [bacterium]
MARIHDLWRLWLRQNWWMTAAIIMLLTVGVLFIHSATHLRTDRTLFLDVQQMRWALVGMTVYWSALWLDYRRLRDGTWAFYGLVVALLIAVLFVGVKIYGARRWLMAFGMVVQPSELGKLAVILALAVWLAARERSAAPPAIWKAFALAALPMVLIMKEPDLGTALVFVPITMAMLFIGGASWRPLLALIVAGALAVTAVLAMVMLPEMLGMRPERQESFFHRLGLSHYQRDRIEVFLRPDSDPLGAGWNRRQSEIAVGSGGVYGRGYMQGRQNLYGFLPRTVSPTDFIFAVIAEETGFAGATALLGLYVVLIGCGLMTALRAPDMMGRMLCIGITTLIFSHVFINVAMTTGLLPVTGIPLPLVSYGGTFLVSTLLMLGLMQSVYVRKAS